MRSPEHEIDRDKTYPQPGPQQQVGDQSIEEGISTIDDHQVHMFQVLPDLGPGLGLEQRHTISGDRFHVIRIVHEVGQYCHGRWQMGHVAWTSPRAAVEGRPSRSRYRSTIASMSWCLMRCSFAFATTRARRSGDLAISSMTLARLAGSFGGARRPRSLPKRAGIPPTAVAMQGTSAAMASSNTIGNPSLFELITKQS